MDELLMLLAAVLFALALCVGLAASAVAEAKEVAARRIHAKAVRMEPGVLRIGWAVRSWLV